MGKNIRIRRGGTELAGDGLRLDGRTNPIKNCRIENCSVAFCPDEAVHIIGNVSDTVLQRCLFAYAVDNANGALGKGVRLDPDCRRLGVVDCWFVHCNQRHPHLQGTSYAIGNRIYNPKNLCIDHKGGSHHVQGCVMLPGADTPNSLAMLTIQDTVGSGDVILWGADNNPKGQPEVTNNASPDPRIEEPFMRNLPARPRASQANVGAWPLDWYDLQALADMDQITGSHISSATEVGGIPSATETLRPTIQ